MVTGIIAVLIILVVVLCFSQKQYERNRTQIEKAEDNNEEIYIKFEQLYENIEKELKGVTKELQREGCYEDNSIRYAVYFNESLIKRKEDQGLHLYYFDGDALGGKEELKEELNNLNSNENLKNLLKEITEEGIVRAILITNLAENIRIISFQINVQYTSFVKNNNNSINSIVFCEDEECQKYGYYKIRENWFIRISPRPE